MWPSQEIMAVAKNSITMVKESMEKDRVAATTPGCSPEPECLPQNMLLLGQQALEPHHLGLSCVLQPLDNVGYWDQQQSLTSASLQQYSQQLPFTSQILPLATENICTWEFSSFEPGNAVMGYTNLTLCLRVALPLQAC